MRRSSLLLCAGALVLATPLAACGDDDTTSDPPPPADGGSTLTVGAQDDLTFDADAYDVEAGNVTVVYDNEGTVAHTLLIDGVDDFKLSVGREDRGTVELEPGTYELYCDVAGHQAAGMEAELTVT